MDSSSSEEARVPGARSVSSPPVSVLDTFELLPKLPIELRLMIWRACFPPCQKVSLRELFCKASNAPRQRLLPVSLRINRESREETLRHYVVKELTRPGRVGILCFRPGHDILYFQNNCWSGHLFWLWEWLRKDPSFFRNVDIIEIHRWGIWSAEQTWALDCIALFPDLRQVRLLERKFSNENQTLSGTITEGINLRTAEVAESKRLLREALIDRVPDAVSRIQQLDISVIETASYEAMYSEIATVTTEAQTMVALQKS